MSSMIQWLSGVEYIITWVATTFTIGLLHSCLKQTVRHLIPVVISIWQVGQVDLIHLPALPLTGGEPPGSLASDLDQGSGDCQLHQRS